MKKLVLAALLAAIAGGAFAQVYVGGSYGRARQDLDCAGFDTCKKTVPAYKGYVGFVVNEYAAVEAGYANFGRAYANVAVSNQMLKSSFTSDALFLVGSIRVPVTPELSGVGRLGVAEVHTTLETEFAGRGTTDSGVHPQYMWGLGVQLSLSKQLTATADADFTRTSKVPTSAGVTLPEGTVRVFTVGGQYKF